MGPVFETVGAWLTEQGFEYDTQGEEVFAFRYRGENGIWQCFVVCREDEEQVLFYSAAPIAVPEERRIDMAEYILRANYGSVLGGFEMDVDDGELRYATGLDFTDTKLDPLMLRNMALSNVLMMDTYLPGALAVIHGGVAPDEAIDKTEQAEAEEQAEA